VRLLYFKREIERCSGFTTANGARRAVLHMQKKVWDGRSDKVRVG
jgi:hypothetical protein